MFCFDRSIGSLQFHITVAARLKKFALMLGLRQSYLSKSDSLNLLVNYEISCENRQPVAYFMLLAR